MTKTHKDRDGALVCDNCESVLVWLQNKAGKWYLANGKKGLVNTSTRYEYGSQVVVTPLNKAPHFADCESLAKRAQRRREVN